MPKTAVKPMALPLGASSLTLTAAQKSICERILNAFETGSADGDYSNISIYRDGPHDIRQITYGRSQTTEYGHLRELVANYAAAGGTHSAALGAYVERIGHQPLVDNSTFKNLLRAAGASDPVMRRTQDLFFDRRYFQPAMKWAGEQGFTEALSALVIYDSFNHSGGILPFLRSRFPELPPAAGGDERTWIRQYVAVCHDWLATHSRPILQNTIYRTRCFRNQIALQNWDLSQVPIDANGVAVRPKAVPQLAPQLIVGAGDSGNLFWQVAEEKVIPFLGPEAIQSFSEQLRMAALAEWELFGRQERNIGGGSVHQGVKENDDSVYQRVGAYWKAVGRDDLDGKDRDWPWSAAFISWLMKESGAEARFSYSDRKSVV